MKFEGTVSKHGMANIACLICKHLPENSVIETEQVFDLGLRETTLGRGDVASHVPDKEMAVSPLELSKCRFEQLYDRERLTLLHTT